MGRQLETTREPTRGEQGTNAELHVDSHGRTFLGPRRPDHRIARQGGSRGTRSNPFDHHSAALGTTYHIQPERMYFVPETATKKAARALGSRALATPNGGGSHKGI